MLLGRFRCISSFYFDFYLNLKMSTKLSNMTDTILKSITELEKGVKECESEIKNQRVQAIRNENLELQQKIDLYRSELTKMEHEIEKIYESQVVPTAYCLPVAAPPPNNESIANEKVEKIKQEKPKKQEQPKVDKDDDIDVGRLNMIVGKIIEIKKHPDADSLYVEKVDVGEAEPLTVVSGLVKHVPINEMENRLVIILRNLKPAKMRGITSEGMVMCASTPEKVEVLAPPQGSCPGDIVTVPGFKLRPDPVMNPKKKIFETVAPDLKTDKDRIACYKGIQWTIQDKGPVTAQTLTCVNIK